MHSSTIGNYFLPTQKGWEQFWNIYTFIALNGSDSLFIPAPNNFGEKEREKV